MIIHLALYIFLYLFGLAFVWWFTCRANSLGAPCPYVLLGICCVLTIPLYLTVLVLTIPWQIGAAAQYLIERISVA